METVNVKLRNWGLLITRFVLISLLLINYINIAAQPVCGKVTNASDNSPLPGVNVVIKGTSTGVVTDVTGSFCIDTKMKKTTLSFNYIGFNPVDIIVKPGDTLQVVLNEDVKTLNEVVVMGYGMQKRSMLTGAVAGVNTRVRGLITSEAKDMCMSANMASVQYNSYQPTYFNPSHESYCKINENGFKSTISDPLSTFSIDVDKASYANVRRFINMGQLPPADAVRIEEMINYFDYDYPQPTDEHPFSINTEYTDCPWQEGHKLLSIGLQGKKIPTDNLPPSNLVFLLDVSGSMAEPNKLPLVKAAFRLLVNNLREKDHVAIIVYAGAAGLVLPSTRGDKKEIILDALNSLQAGGSTAGCQGIELAYRTAKENYIRNGNNRVILATDGDFNVGLSAENELEDFIVKKRDDGIFLTCLGFGMGNYKDSKIELLSDKGNGNYAYIDDIIEANKVFVNEFGGTLFTIAKDVKIQIEFNPAIVQSYRLVGYENRLLNNEDFKDDKKDAGELGSGHTVTALYEIIPVGITSKFVPDIDNLKYQNKVREQNETTSEVATVKFRYKKPDGNKSIEMIQPIINQNVNFSNATNNIRFAASIAMFGMVLTNSEFKGLADYEKLLEIASNSRGNDKEGYRGEFIRLVKTTKNLGLSTAK